MLRYLLVPLAALVLATLPAYADRDADCRQNADLDRRIAGCTEIIGDEGLTAESRAAASYERGNAYAVEGDFDRAITDYDQAIALNPNHADAYFNRGNAYNEKSDTEHAIADLRMVLSIDPTDDEAKEVPWMLGGEP